MKIYLRTASLEQWHVKTLFCVRNIYRQHQIDPNCILNVSIIIYTQNFQALLRISSKSFREVTC